jgi:hypothetical protein
LKTLGAGERSIYCGVLDFTAPTNTIILPFWIFQHLSIREAELLSLTIVTETLPKCTDLKIQAHETLFNEIIEDPKSFLELGLKRFNCLCEGNTIQLSQGFGDLAIFNFNIIDVKPKNEGGVALILDTNVNLEFEMPLDTPEGANGKLDGIIDDTKIARNPAPKSKVAQRDADGNPIFSGGGLRLDGLKIDTICETDEKLRKWNPRKEKLKRGVRPKFEQHFKAFQGKGVRM